ncbi:helix-turn-helix domain-containing protein [Flagellimonas sp. S174]|uniref:helix-turn-helix domain-containing protein n=1 Tax=Flagellimonas sp. S174 TaxID=3410790 RepID=UPI003BF593BD
MKARQITLIQKLYIPNSHQLRQVINFFSYVEFQERDSSEDWLSIFPNATTNMAICLGDKMEFPTGHGDNGVSIVCTSIANLRVATKLRFVTIQFNSYGLYAFKGIPMHEMYNSHVDLEMLFKPSECEVIRNELSESNSTDEVFEKMESFMTNKLKNSVIDPRMPYSIALLSQNKYSMDDVSGKICLTPRGFRKLFSNQIGFSPAYYRKITRFNRAAFQINTFHGLSLTEIAYQNGYYDQSHFIKDFKHFSGISSRKYQNIKAKSTDFYNYKSTDPANLG